MADQILLNDAHREVKLYLCKTGVSDADILNYCNTTVRTWLGQNDVTRADFWIATGGDGVRVLVAAINQVDTDWSKMPNVKDFLEADWEEGNPLSATRQRLPRIPPQVD
jgi:hypothetical protein